MGHTRERSQSARDLYLDPNPIPEFGLRSLIVVVVTNKLFLLLFYSCL